MKNCVAFKHSLYFTKRKLLKKLWKIYQKTCFCCRDIQVFAPYPSSLFLSLYLLENLVEDKFYYEVCNVIMCLSRNLNTQIFQYFGKQRRSDIKTWSIDKVLYKENFRGEICRKLEPEISPTLLFDFSK